MVVVCLFWGTGPSLRPGADRGCEVVETMDWQRGVARTAAARRRRERHTAMTGSQWFRSDVLGGREPVLTTDGAGSGLFRVREI